ISASFDSASSIEVAVTASYPCCRMMVERSNRFSSRSSSSNTRIGFRSGLGITFSPPPLPPLVSSAIVRLSVFLFVLLAAAPLLRQLGKFIENRDRAQPLPVIDRRITAHDLARFHVVRDTALRRRDSAVADLAVSRHADLSGEDHI